jgi:hypothetical protein
LAEDAAVAVAVAVAGAGAGYGAGGFVSLVGDGLLLFARLEYIQNLVYLRKPEIFPFEQWMKPQIRRPSRAVESERVPWVGSSGMSSESTHHGVRLDWAGRQVTGIWTSTLTLNRS